MYKVLSIIFLGIRSTFKADAQCFVAKFVYNSLLSIPDTFFIFLKIKNKDKCKYAGLLSERIKKL